MGAKNKEENKPYALNYGFNYRHKERTFKSLFVGVRAKDFRAASVDELSLTFTDTNFNNGLTLRLREADRYEAALDIMAGFANFDFQLENKLSGNLGLRFERDEINVIWDVANFVGRVGTLNRTYESIYPSVNLK